MVKIAVNGAGGRMGSRILALADASHFDIVGAYENETSPLRGKKISLSENRSIQIDVLSPSALKGKGVLIDFSSPTGVPTSLLCAERAHWGLVIGTTGVEERTQQALRRRSSKIPIVFSSNMSIGVNVMLALVAEAAQKLSNEFEIKMSETHHCHKKDAPSGTALMLLRSIADAKKWNSSQIAEEKSRIRSIREGEIVGDHTVLFSGPAETLEITHRAQSRDTFARGALLAALFLSKKKKGLFNMQDVLGLWVAGTIVLALYVAGTTNRPK